MGCVQGHGLELADIDGPIVKVSLGLSRLGFGMRSGVTTLSTSMIYVMNELRGRRLSRPHLQGDAGVAMVRLDPCSRFF